MKKPKKSRATAKRKAAKKAPRARRQAAAADHAHAGDGVDGCDLDFNETDATPDEALPQARGGVAAVGRRARGMRAFV